MELCRACLSTNKMMIRIDEKFISNYNLLTNLNISLADGLPQSSCYTCLDFVQRFIEFRDRCLKAESLLKQASCLDIKPEESSEEIKAEIKDEDNVDELSYNYENINDDDFETIHINDYDAINGNYLEEVIATATKDVNKKRKRGRPKFTRVKQKKHIKFELNKRINENVLTEKHISVTEQKKKRNRSKIIPKVMDMNLRRRCLKLEKTVELGVDDIIKEAVQTLSETVKGEMLIPKKILKKEVQSKQIFACGLCSNKFEEKDERDSHIESHRGSRYCKQCSENFDSWSQQLAHRVKHVSNDQMNCHLCLKRYVTCNYLEFHYRNEHFQEEGLLLKCKICLSSYDDPIKLRKHVWSAHKDKTISCDFCPKLYSSMATLRAHMVLHTGQKAFSCDLCDYKSKYSCGLRDHMIRKHTATKVTCKVCSRVFANEIDMEKHKCPKTSVVCPICGLQFSVKHKLTRHMRSHTEGSKYECSRCPAKFKTRGALNIHNDRHEGNRRNQCEYCPAKFYAQSSLIKHRRIHTGEKPYVCKICNKGFTGNNNLKLHMRVHGQFGLIKKKVKDDSVQIF